MEQTKLKRAALWITTVPAALAAGVVLFLAVQFRDVARIHGELFVRGLVLLVLQFGGSAAMITGILLVGLPLVPHVRGWKRRWRHARYEFSSGEEGLAERRRVKRAQFRGLAVMGLGMAAHLLAGLLKRLWFDR